MTPDSNACDSSLNAGSDRSRNDTARQTGSRPVIRGSLNTGGGSTNSKPL